MNTKPAQFHAILKRTNVWNVQAVTNAAETCSSPAQTENGLSKKHALSDVPTTNAMSALPTARTNNAVSTAAAELAEAATAATTARRHHSA